LPNLPTVPGDPLVGAVLAATAAGQDLPARPALGVALAALFLYMAGLVLNDLHDLPDDRLHRPERPLPRGLVSVRAAWLAFVLLATLGIAMAATAGRSAAAGGLVLLALICLYTLRAKARPASACLVMGLCRGASMMLGAVAVGHSAAVLLPATALTVYIGAVTWLSRREDETQRPGTPILLPQLAIFAGCAAAWASGRTIDRPFLAVSLAGAALAVGAAAAQSLRLFRHDTAAADARAAVGRFIGLLLPWQAALVVLGGTPVTTITALVLLAAWPLARQLARRFSAS
jgi:4-hydroxybenzoate polyprenyltransferase